ncbi:MAG TPA: DUF4388 domain-containing protein [Thermoanaerobaculia bacterium]|nr:DUF4388 domain-containing protein [Thermoanaerobaculia bacterium]
MSLERIEITPFTNVIGEILSNRSSGVLSILHGKNRKALYWAQGELVLTHSSAPEESLSAFLEAKGVISHHQAGSLETADPTEIVLRFFETDFVPPSARQSLMREWITSLTIPLFSLDEGTMAFSEETPIDPERRMFLQSTAALVIEGIRSISNGLVLRRGLGDIKRVIDQVKSARYELHSLPFSPAEARLAASLQPHEAIESFLKRSSTESGIAAKTMVMMLTLGIVAAVIEQQAPQRHEVEDDSQKDLAILAALGSGDQRSLHAVGLAKRAGTLDFYQFLDLPRAATRGQIALKVEEMKRNYDPARYPAVVRESLTIIQRRADEALSVLNNALKRQEYDRLLMHPTDKRDDLSMQQKITRRSIAEQNYRHAEELSIKGDYYGAIVLLRQAVDYAPEHAEAWFLLGSCQQRNPRWRRDAMDSLQKAVSINPNHIEALISLGDLYKAHGLASRAQACYEDVMKMDPENGQAKSRLKNLK